MIKALLNRFRFELKLLRYLIPNIYFNFHYLPFMQAFKLPIVFYKPHFGMLKGKVSIKTGGAKITHGMIKLGFNGVALYPNNGIRFQIAGGNVVFKGSCYIGSSGAIAVGRKGILVFGDKFCSTAAIKIACQHQIVFGNNVLCGWESTFMDSDFHQLSSVDSQQQSPRAFAPILIGDGCWFGYKTLIMKGTKFPENCTVSSNSMCNKEYTDNYTIYAGSPAKARIKGLYRDYKNDTIYYPEINE